MKFGIKSSVKSRFILISLTASIGPWAVPAAMAATQPAHIASFTADQPTQTLSTRHKGWRDPAFGDMGWTHFSDWGTFQARKGHPVTITAVSSNPDIHPGITVWYRGANDTAPDTYVVDHFYAQSAPQFKLGATDESTGAVIGNIVMSLSTFGYDLDGQSKALRNLRGKRDGVPGQLVIKWVPQNTGTFMFVLGAVNPGPGASDSTIRYDIETTVIAK